MHICPVTQINLYKYAFVEYDTFVLLSQNNFSLQLKYSIKNTFKF